MGDLAGESPEEMYEKDCILRGFRDDPCLLYVFRMAVHFAEHDVERPEKLQWWRFKDPGMGEP